jgi:thymidylate kinase
MKESWNISGLILEGICGTGKTTIFHSLLQSERFVHKSFLSSIVLSEHQTQRVLEQKEREEGLLLSDNVSLLNEHVTYLESLNNRLDQMSWCQNNRTNMRLPYVFERFHFTHVYHYDHVCWEDVQEIDSRLANLNCKLCLFTMDDSFLKHRIIESRDSDWRDYLKRYGETDEEILEYYAVQQEMLSGLCEKSKLDTLIVDTTDTSVQDTLDQVFDFWGAI